jgi:hypothetical protein
MLSLSSLVTLLLPGPGMTALAQQDTAKAPVYGWTHGLLAGVSLTQASYTDWAAGGENSLAYTASLDGKSTQDMEHTNWVTTYKFAFGQSRLGTQGLRKTDDRIDLETVLTYKLSEHWNPYGAATFKSQFATGYEYDDLGGKTAVSAFFDPAYLTQTAGIEYKPGPVFKTRFGAGLRETFTTNYPIYADDPETVEVETTLFQGILESVSDLTLTVAENVVFTSRLELIAPFETLDQITVRSDNILAAKINEYFTAKVNVELLNDWRVTRRTQVRETVALGFSYALL